MQVSFNCRQSSFAVILPFVACIASFWSGGAQAADPVLGAPSTTSAPATESGKTYVVKPGDTLDNFGAPCRRARSCQRPHSGWRCGTRAACAAALASKSRAGRRGVPPGCGNCRVFSRRRRQS